MSLTTTARTNGKDPKMSNQDRTAEIAAARAADEKIAAAWDLYWEAMLPVERLRKEVRSTEKMVRYYGGAGSQGEYYTTKLERKQTELEEALAKAAPLREAAEQLNKELYKGWSRFFLVQHIHRAMNCSSFRPTTRIGWLPSVSGLTEAEAVAEHGATLCTICFPSAPTELTTKPVDDSICEMSGKFAPRERGYFRYADCPSCGTKGVSVTSLGKFRKHKK